MSAPISRKVAMKPMRVGFSNTPSTMTSEPGRDQRRGDDEGRRARVGGNGDVPAFELGVAPDRDGAGAARRHPRRQISAPKWMSMRSVWSRVGTRLDHGGAARRMQAGQQHGRLHLRRRHRQVVDGWARDRTCRAPRSGSVRRSSSTRRPMVCSGASTRPMGRRRKRRVAGELHRHVMACDHPEHEAAAGAGIAEVERAAGAAQAAHPLALDRERCRSRGRLRRQAPLRPWPWPSRRRPRAGR